MAKNILIASSEEALREFLSDLFSSCGAKVRTVSDAVNCVHEVEERLPDLLILDDALLWGGAEGVLECLFEGGKLPGMDIVRLVGRPANAEATTSAVAAAV